MTTISQLHYITQDLPNYSHAQLTEFACKGGAEWIQLRVKNSTFEEWLKIATETKSICRKYGAKLIINDNARIATEVGADGVHLGKNDMSPKEARKILGSSFIIGGSTNTPEDVKRMMDEGCDYIGIGPFRFTSTKEKLNPVLGLEGIRIIAEKFGKKIPMIAIGGIKKEDIVSLMQTGIHGIAVSSGINMVEDRIGSTKEFLMAIQHLKLP